MLGLEFQYITYNKQSLILSIVSAHLLKMKPGA